MNEQSIPVSNANEYVFPNAWGGATRSASPPLIHNLALQLRRQIKGLEAKKAAGVMFPVRGAKDLNQKLANALNDLDLHAPVVAQDITHVDVAAIAPYPGRDGGPPRPAFRTLVHCKATVRLIAPDGSFMEFVGSGHGGDADDKAGGKASTYAWKDAVLKGLSIPHEDMVDTDDEQPSNDVAGSRGGAATGGKTVARPANSNAPAAPARAAVSEPLPASPDAAVPQAASPGSFADRIRGAKTLDGLSALQGEIKSGSVKLEGKARLDAAAAFIARQKELKA